MKYTKDKKKHLTHKFKRNEDVRERCTYHRPCSTDDWTFVSCPTLRLVPKKEKSGSMMGVNREHWSRLSFFVFPSTFTCFVLDGSNKIEKWI